jgi:hypothetical protein
MSKKLNAEIVRDGITTRVILKEDDRPVRVVAGSDEEVRKIKESWEAGTYQLLLE